MTDHTTGTREEWLAAREQLLVREKEHTRLSDELAQQRRELPWAIRDSNRRNRGRGSYLTLLLTRLSL